MLVGWLTCYVHVNWQYAWKNQSWPYAAAMVDAGLRMQNETTGMFCINPGGPDPGGGCAQAEAACNSAAPPPCSPNGCCGSASAVWPSCHQLDGVWAVTRSSAQAGGYRKQDVRQMCRRFLTGAAAVMNNRTLLLDTTVYGDSHGLNGALQAVAECGHWFPDLLLTQNKWTVTLDLAPFM